MVKFISIMIMFCLCSVFGIKNTSYADTKTEKALLMQEHIEKVESTNPEIYQEMLEKAGGNIRDCLSCHKDMLKKKKTFGPADRSFPK